MEYAIRIRAHISTGGCWGHAAPDLGATDAGRLKMACDEDICTRGAGPVYKLSFQETKTVVRVNGDRGRVDTRTYAIYNGEPDEAVAPPFHQDPIDDRGRRDVRRSGYRGFKRYAYV